MRKTFAASIFWLLLGGLRLTAQGLVGSLLMPDAQVAPGAQVEFNLVLLNPGKESALATFPSELHGRLSVGDTSWPVTIVVRNPTTNSIAPGAFASTTGSFLLPLEAHGRLIFDIDQPRLSGTLTVADKERVAETKPASGAAAPLEGAIEVPAIAQYQRVFAENIATHHPIYFLFGTKKPAAKFQFSFKYRLWSDESSANALKAPLSGVYFGYTQRSLWDITSYSSPFYDTSYMPEIMYESLAPASGKPWLLGTRWLGYQAAVQHESNGRDGNHSRSMNLLYVRPMFGWDLGNRWALAFAPKLFVYLDNLSDNPDLERYRGYGEYVWVLSRKNSWSLTALGRLGSHFDRGSIQLDLAYPLRTTFGNFASFLLVQYFDGYGESLLGYDQRSRVVRAGFALVR